MKNVLIVEHSNQSLIKENVNANNNGKKDYVLSGIFTEFGVRNRNDRIYTAESFLPALNEMNERISNMVVYGELDHPDVFDTSLSRVSHVVTKAVYKENLNRVDGEIKLVPTHCGKDAMALIDEGYPLYISSRAAGVTNNEGYVTINKLWSYDIVSDPGFKSARMQNQPLNESLGFNNNSNFRIIPISDENKINELFNMNKNDNVTKNQLNDYSKYLQNEIHKVKTQMIKESRGSKLNADKMNKMSEYFDALQNDYKKVTEYLNYLSEKIQVVVKENNELKEKQSAIVAHNKQISEKLSKTINYSKYLAENVDKSIAYGEYLGEGLKNSIKYTEYLKENLQKNIEYSEYLKENTEKHLNYSDYLKEKIDESIKYNEDVAKSVKTNIEYSNYLAEKVNSSIRFSEYIAENANNTEKYGKYLAENLDKSITYQKDIVDKINENKLNESVNLPSFDSVEFGKINKPSEKINEGENCDKEDCKDVDCNSENKKEETKEEPKKADNKKEDTVKEQIKTEDVDVENLSEKIDQLIEATKKQKIAEKNDFAFLNFLNENEIKSFYSLSDEDKETVKAYFENKLYYSKHDVLVGINEALAATKETFEERLVRLIPESIKPVWDNASDVEKRSIISQAKLYPTENLMTESQVENFWLTRHFAVNESKKTLIDKNVITNDDVLSTDYIENIKKRFDSLSL